MTPIEDVLLWALAQQGDRYVLGAEADRLDADPGVFDCSELVEWACSRAGVVPTVPDGSGNQLAHARQHGTLITVDGGLDTRGALLHRADNGDWGHVAISLGDGTTVEARGTKYGVGVWPTAGRRWTHASLIPGVDYTPRPQLGDYLFDRLDPLTPRAADGRRPFWRIYASGWVEAVNGARPLTHLGGIDLAGEITGAHLVDGLLVLS
ncbi:MAG: C40 family peptidase, partial [Actinomycetia bacterium]|nr:C40 family peptidase [Actinomycetes bacterium]